MCVVLLLFVSTIGLGLMPMWHAKKMGLLFGMIFVRHFLTWWRPIEFTFGNPSSDKLPDPQAKKIPKSS